MIAIRFSAGEEIGLSKINLEIPLSLFERTTILGKRSTAIKLPNSREIRKLLLYPTSLNNRTFTKTIKDVELIVSNSIVLKGDLKIIGANKNKIDCVFVDGLGAIKDALDRSLNSFSYGGVRDIPKAGAVITVNEIKAFLSSTVNGTPDDYDFVFAPFAIGPFDITNFYNPQTASFDETNYAYINPFPYLHFVVRSIFDELGYSISGNFFNKEEIKFLTIYNLYARNYTEVMADPTIDISKALPNIKVKDLLIELSKLFNLDIRFSPLKKEVIINEVDELLENNSYVDWTNKVDTNFSYAFENQITGLNLIQEQNITDIFGSPANIEFFQGEPEYKEVSTSIIYPSMVQGVVPAYAFSMLFPQVNPDNRNTNWINDYEYPLRLSFYRGFQPASTGTYPLLTPLDKSYNGINIPNIDYSLEWEGDKGLFKKCYEKWFGLYEKYSGVKTSVFLSLQEVLREDYLKDILVNDTFFRVENINIEFVNSNKYKCQISMVRKL